MDQHTIQTERPKQHDQPDQIDSSTIQRVISAEFIIGEQNKLSNKRNRDDLEKEMGLENELGGILNLGQDIENTDTNENYYSKKQKKTITEKIYLTDINIHLYDISDEDVINSIYSIDITSMNALAIVFEQWSKMLKIQISNLNYICNFTNLVRITLNNLYINNLPNNLYMLKSLEYVDFSNNIIFEFKNSNALNWFNLNTIFNFQLPKSVKILNLSKLGLQYIPFTVYYITQLEELYIDNNSITEIDYAGFKMSNLTKLQKFSIANNKITYIPDSFKFLKLITCIDLSGNKINKICKNLTALENLERLILVNCDIEYIDDSMCNLTKLTILDLTKNKLMNFPDCMCNLQLLEQIALQNNNLSVINPLISRLQKLSHLVISFNNLHEIDTNTFNLPNLVYLDLNNNLIKTIPNEIGNLKNLLTLKLNANLITTLPITIGNLVNLKTFSIIDNNIFTLPEIFTGLKSLLRFRINNNNLEVLPMDLLNATELEIFEFNGNPIINIPPPVNRFIENINNPQMKPFANDNQNIHSSTIQRGFVDSVKRLMNQKVVIDKDIIIRQWTHDTILVPECKNEIKKMYLIKDVQTALNVSYRELFEYVWAIITNQCETIQFTEETQKEIKIIMNQEIIEASELCFTGKITRLLNCLNGFSSLITLQITESEEIGNIIVHVQKMLRKNGEYTVEKHRSLVRAKLVENGINEDVITVWVDNIDDDE